MGSFEAVTSAIALTMGVAWASGINLYAAILVLGLLGSTGNMTLPPDLQLLTHPVVMTAAGIMFLLEFFADKVPGLDSAWDGFHTFIRIPAGAVLAAGAVGEVNPALAVAAGIVGGSVAAATHATKSGTRLLINSSPEPFSNWVASFSEDLLVLGGLWAALHYPLVFLGLLLVFIVAVAILLPKLWRGIGALLSRLIKPFRRGLPTAPA